MTRVYQKRSIKKNRKRKNSLKLKRTKVSKLKKLQMGG